MQSEKEEPIPESPTYVNPTKMVKTINDMNIWEHSEAYHEYLGFICTLNDAIKGKANEQGSVDASEEINKICGLLNSLDKWIDEIPPIKQPQRFGNQAFREWYARLKDRAGSLLQSILPNSLHQAIQEIMIYVVEGFGNSTRIDYGTGHELSFLMFLCALFKIGYLKISDGPSIACKVFVRYLEVVRKLQTVYNMEPAGSHGVWSLDDYQFVPFIWGSSQFIGNIQLEPTCFLKENIIKRYSSQYMFLSCIQYINMVKTGPFAEHSNQLWSISAVSSWEKINSGLIKMYRAEVLAKFPLVQHIYFGSIFSLRPFVPPPNVRPKTSFQALNQSPLSMKYTDAINLGAMSSFAKTVSIASSESGNSKHSMSSKYVDSVCKDTTKNSVDFAISSKGGFDRKSKSTFRSANSDGYGGSKNFSVDGHKVSVDFVQDKKDDRDESQPDQSNNSTTATNDASKQ